MKLVPLVVLFFLAQAVLGQDSPDAPLRTFRASFGLSLPQLDTLMSAACGTRAAELARSGELSHTDTQGKGPAFQMLSQGFPPGEYGEVLGAGTLFATVWEAWLNSPSHRKVLESPGWTTWGWASVSLGKTTVWVLRFWKP